MRWIAAILLLVVVGCGAVGESDTAIVSVPGYAPPAWRLKATPELMLVCPGQFPDADTPEAGIEQILSIVELARADGKPREEMLGIYERMCRQEYEDPDACLACREAMLDQVYPAEPWPGSQSVYSQ